MARGCWRDHHGNHPLVAEILDEGIAGVIAHDRQIIIFLTKRSTRRPAWDSLFAVIAKQVHGQHELPLAVLAIHAARPLLGPRQRRQQQRRNNRDDGDYHQKLDQREPGTQGESPRLFKAVARLESSADPSHIAKYSSEWFGWGVCVWRHTGSERIRAIPRQRCRGRKPRLFRRREFEDQSSPGVGSTCPARCSPRSARHRARDGCAFLRSE